MLQLISLVLAFALSTTALVTAQDKEKDKTPSAPAKSAVPVNPTPLKVQVVIGRYQGEKKIASMPYTLTVVNTGPGSHATLRMGAKIPVVMMMMANVPKDAPQGGPVQYQDVGTNIDCFTTELDNGRYSVAVTIDDSSVYPDDQGSKSNPSFRSFRATNGLILKNGETGQFMAATDKVTGETVRVDVTLTVVR
jgi:hypothetical protein